MVLFLSITALGLMVTIGYGIFSYRRIHRLIDQGKRLAQQAVPYERFVSATSPTALFIGDSTGVGVGALDPLASLAGRFAHDLPHWNITNLSISGSKTRDLLPVLHSLRGHTYTTLVIQIGGNDIVRFSDLVQLQHDIQTVFQEAKELSPRVFCLTCGNVETALLIPRPIASLWKRRTLAVRKVFLSAAKETGVTYIDLFIADPEADPFTLLPYRYHAADLFHPSALGYGLWYTQLKQKLENDWKDRSTTHIK